MMIKTRERRRMTRRRWRSRYLRRRRMWMITVEWIIIPFKAWSLCSGVSSLPNMLIYTTYLSLSKSVWTQVWRFLKVSTFGIKKYILFKKEWRAVIFGLPKDLLFKKVEMSIAGTHMNFIHMIFPKK